MYYEVPPKPTSPKSLKAVFPWEEHTPKATRLFLEDINEPDQTSGFRQTSTRNDDEYIQTSSGSWESYVRANAWDDVPEIEKYMRSLQKPRQARATAPSGSADAGKYPFPSTFSQGSNFRMNQFSTGSEQPSLSATPAPIGRRGFLGRDSEENQDLPTAEGVPDQDDWVGITVNAFISMLNATYLYWKLTEPIGTTRGTSASQFYVP